MKVIALSFVVAAALSSDASAQAYIGGQVGTSNAPAECGWLKPGNYGDCRSSAWKILGGYKLNRNLAVELGYADLGRFNADLSDGTKATAHATAVDLVGVLTLPITGRVSVYGKAGIADGMSHASKNTNNTFVENNDTTALTYGAGISYAISDHNAIRADWQSYNFIGDVKAFTLGMVHNF